MGYRIAPNFRGRKFSRIGHLQIFAEINFADRRFQLTTPICGHCGCQFTRKSFFVVAHGCNNAMFSCSFPYFSFLLWCKLGVGSSRFPSLEFDHVLHLTVGSRNGSRRNFLRKRTSWIWKFRITRLEITVESLSCLIWTPLKLVPPGTNFSEIFGPTLKNLIPL